MKNYEGLEGAAIIIPILWSKIEFDLILDNRDQLGNILEIIRTRKHDGNKSQEIISEFGVANTLRVSGLL